MIAYFADRHMNILGVASDLLPGAFHLRDDMKTSELENGVSTFEVTFDYKKDTHVTLKKYCAAGNFLLVKEKGRKYTPYTIIDKEDDIADKHIYIYAEDAGLDLLNEIVPAYEAVSAATARDYILAFTADSGFEIGIDELGTSVTKTLHWDGEETAASRVRSVALEFDNAEIGYSFTIDKFRITHKYIDIYKKHGKDVALELRFGREIDDIVERESVANLVTALRCHGGTPESTDAHPEPVPITFEHDGYEPHVYHYDDGDIYTDGFYLKSREYNKKWTRYLTESGTGEGYIVGAFSYDTTSQKELCDQAIAELKRLREPEITYEVSLNTIPENLKLGDTCRLVDDNGELYISARLIELKVSECNRTREATFGDFKKLTSGINDKVEKLAEEFAKIQAAKTLYTWMVFADDASGTNMSTSSAGKEYIGIATNKISPDPDLTNPLLYTFTRISAVDGRGFTVRGSWAPNTSYSITGTNIDVVEHEGSTYACNNSHVSGQTFDPSKWVLIAEKGTDGEDGYSPTATVTKSGDTTTITITDKNGTTTQTILDGEDGHSPTITTTKSGTTTTILADGVSIGTVTDGDDGHSPAVTATKTDGVTTVKVDGTTIATINDGSSVIIQSATKVGDTTTVILKDGSGTQTLTIKDGEDGDNGQPGSNGDDAYVHIAWATSADGSEGFSTSVSEGKTYMGSYSDHTLADSQTPSDYNWSLIKGEDGYSPTATVTKSGSTATITITDKNGTTTETVSDGRSITGVTNYYLATSASSGVTRSTSGWTTSVQSMASTNQYLWNYEELTYSSGTTTTYTDPVIIGRYGQDGQGGSAGKGITGITEYYQVSNSNSQAPTTWVTTPPATTTSNPYLWNYEVITYTTGDPFTSEKRVIGTHGATGATGEQGFCLRGSLLRDNWNDSEWAAHATDGYETNYSNWDIYKSGSSHGPDGKLPISTWNVGDLYTVVGTAKDTGIAYIITYKYTTKRTTDTTTIPSLFVSITHAERGATGATGETGQSSYTFIRYSANADGSNMTTTPQSDTEYIGVYTATASSEPSVPSYTAFTWSKYVGEDGNGIVSKTDYYLLADTMVSTELSTAKSHVPHDLSGSIVTMADAMGDIPLKNLTVDVVPVQSGSGDPSPTNIRPITGWDGAKIYRYGKNLLPSTLPDHTINATFSNGIITTATNARIFGIIVAPNTDYALSQGSTGTGWTIAFSNKLPQIGDTVDYRGNMQNRTEWILNSGNNTYMLICPSSEADYGSIVNTLHGQIEIGNVPTAYEQYVSAEYPVTWSEAGTVYGGRIDVLRGKLTVTHQLVTVTNCTKGNNRYAVKKFGELGYGDPTGVTLCNALKQYFGTAGSITADSFLILNSGGFNAFQIVMRFAAADSATTTGQRQSLTNAILAQMEEDGNPLQVAFKLANPIEYNLTPTEIITLVGTNNIWANSGDISLTYFDEHDATWQTTPVDPNQYSRYQWWYYNTTYTDGRSIDSDPAIICVYNQDWYDDTQKALAAAETANQAAQLAADNASENATAIGNIQETIVGTTGQAGLIERVGNLENTTATAQSVEDLRSEANTAINNIIANYGLEDFKNWFHFDPNQGLIIGKEGTTQDGKVNYVLRLEGDIIAFYEPKDGIENLNAQQRVGYFQNRNLMSENIVALSTLDIGNFKFVKQDNGNLSFVYAG